MTDHNDTQATLVDAYLDALMQDIHAPPPPGLDALTADLLRDLVSSQSVPMDDALMRRVWLRALVDARMKQQVSPSQNGNLSQSKRQDSPMQTINYPAFTPTQRQHTTRTRLPLTLAIAAAFTLMFAGILFMLNTAPETMPFNTGSGAGVAQQQTGGENVDIEALLERYINELIVAGDTSNVETILSPEHTLNTNFQSAGEFGFDEAINTLVSLSGLIESMTILDIISDADSAWARVEIVQNFMTEPGGRFSTSGIIIAYLDGDTGVFDASYIMFDMLLPADIAAIEVALDVFWGEDAAVLDVNWSRLADSYAADYQLHVELGDTLTTFTATDDLPVARLLELTRTNIAFTHPNIGLDVTETYASGSFIYVDAILNIQAPNEERNANLSIVYRLEDGLIAEEWWTTDEVLFAITDTDE